MKKQRLKRGYEPAPEAKKTEALFTGKLLYCPNCYERIVTPSQFVPLTEKEKDEVLDKMRRAKSNFVDKKLAEAFADPNWCACGHSRGMHPAAICASMDCKCRGFTECFFSKPACSDGSPLGVAKEDSKPLPDGTHEVHIELGANVKNFVKGDAGKNQLDLLPFDALFAVGEVLTFGAKKYQPGNWARGSDWSRYQAAMLRHYVAFAAGEDWDAESGLPHLAHLACDALFLLAYQLRAIGTDDRKVRREGSEPTKVEPPPDFSGAFVIGRANADAKKGENVWVGNFAFQAGEDVKAGDAIVSIENERQVFVAKNVAGKAVP